MYVKKRIDQPWCHDFLYPKLADGLALSQAVLSEKVATSTFFMYLPDSVDVASLLPQHKLNEPDSAAKNFHFLCEEIRSFVALKNGYVVCENSSARHGDDWLKKAQSKVLSFPSSGEVYHLIDTENLNLIEKSLQESSNAWNNIVHFVSGDSIINLDSEEGEIKSESVVVTVVDVFDLDGYLFAEYEKN